MATASSSGPSGAGKARGVPARLTPPATGYTPHTAPRLQGSGTDAMTQQLEHVHTDTTEPTTERTEFDEVLDDASVCPLDVAASDQIDDFRRRLIQEVMAHGSSRYWHRRAATFEWARPRPGDFLGTAGEERARELDARLVATRDACRQRATLAELHEIY